MFLVAAALEKLKKTESERLKLTEARAALTQELRATQHALAQLKEEHHFRAVTLATLHSDNAGLTQRLADRGEEIAALNRQLAQVRSQFDHYQEAAATRRSEERAQAQQRISRLEQDNAQLQQRLQGQQATLVQQDMRLAQLQAEQTRLSSEASADRAALATVRHEAIGQPRVGVRAVRGAQAHEGVAGAHVRQRGGRRLGQRHEGLQLRAQVRQAGVINFLHTCQRGGGVVKGRGGDEGWARFHAPLSTGMAAFS